MRSRWRRLLGGSGALVLWLAACQSGASTSLAERTVSIVDLQPASLAAGERLHVVATTTLVAEVAQIVGGDDISLTTLVGPGFDPHTYEPTPQDARALAQADIVLMNGFGLERFLEDNLLLAGSTSPFLVLSDGVEPLRMADGSGDLDPHVWLDPRNVIVWTDNAGRALAALDPAHAEGYRERAAEYVRALEDLDRRLSERLGAIPPEGRKLVTDHDTLGYFAARFGFTIIGAVIPSASSSAEVSAQGLAALEDAVRREGVRAVFAASEVNADLARQLAEDTGTTFITLHLESLTGPEGPTPTYVALMDYDVEAIARGLAE